VIVDVRQNPGGDNHLYVPLLQLLRDPAVDRPGRLFVVTDRVTFSAAANFATEVEQSTTARFVGEPMGGGLNFWGDARWVKVPNYPVPMQLAVDSRYWQKAAADDPRLTIEPGIPVGMLAADYFGGRDLALDAALTAPPQP
jgi:C-terminal processing protease CtpA/Prc